jgi:ribosomal protein S27AE
MSEATKDGGPAFPALVCRHCSKPFEPKAWHVTSRDYRCLPCKRERQNALNASKGEALRHESRAAYQRRKSYYAAYWAAKSADPLHRQKRAARRKVATEIEAGRLSRGLCEACGAAKTDAHHHDYDKPLDVRWLCRRCHFKEDGHGPAQHV